jgi:hypothetical protein
MVYATTYLEKSQRTLLRIKVRLPRLDCNERDVPNLKKLSCSP